MEKPTDSTQLWKTWNSKANKTGSRAAVFGVKRNPEFGKRIAKDKETEFFATGAYTGEWENNKKAGFGVQTWPNGCKYEGMWSNGKRHGKGTYWVSEGKDLRKQYTGEWQNGLKHGSGVMFYQSGGRYEGKFERGRRHGRGIMMYSNGDVYEGEWAEGKRSGLGLLKMGTGDVYRGHWFQDKREGSGVLFHITTRKMYQGEWCHDVAKCGVLEDIPEGLNVFDQFLMDDDADYEFEIPKLGLKDADAVLESAAAEVEVERFALRMDKPIDELFSIEEIRHLRNAFKSVASGTDMLATDLPKALRALGVNISPKEQQTLLGDLNRNDEDSLTFEDFSRCVADLSLD
eukprot:TRINITY_DN4210_c0_g1_i1.p1 TRINITY_DN4210_c0_g1~~TRINITY_DN4210_c0_g1_i1.p1  ORF type:complete len:345 (-),score=121.40 TRINITY_DN4210_c0_g1_i1:177-1211(-)